MGFDLPDRIKNTLIYCQKVVFWDPYGTQNNTVSSKISAKPLFIWCPHTDSNRGPTDYKSVAALIMSSGNVLYVRHSFIVGSVVGK